MEPVYLALGSNLGDRESYLNAAIRGLSGRHAEIVRCASVYATEPREVLDQPWFLNTAVETRTDLRPDKLLEACLHVEKENLRTRDTAKGPRTHDIDIIFYGSQIIRKPGLSIPHPGFAVRRFVLAPLAEIAADFTDPVSGKTIRRLLADCDDLATVTLVSAARVSCRPGPIERQ